MNKHNYQQFSVARTPRNTIPIFKNGIKKHIKYKTILGGVVLGIVNYLSMFLLNAETTTIQQVDIHHKQHRYRGHNLYYRIPHFQRTSA